MTRAGQPSRGVHAGRFRHLSNNVLGDGSTCPLHEDENNPLGIHMLLTYIVSYVQFMRSCSTKQHEPLALLAPKALRHSFSHLWALPLGCFSWAFSWPALSSGGADAPRVAGWRALITLSPQRTRTSWTFSRDQARSIPIFSKGH